MTVVIPCFNEQARLDTRMLGEAIATRKDWSFVLVDDGSADATPELLDGFRDLDPRRVGVLRLRRNRGKGEAVRHGMLVALDSGAEVVAYTDADFSTPFEELQRLIDRLAVEPKLDVVMGSRFRHLGADVRRSELRHLTGRFYATVASIVLDVGVYDTQCGAKAFRGTPQLVAALAWPFDERWTFDVELLSRLTRGAGPDAWRSVVEEPLKVWHARGGSKVRIADGARAFAELLRIGYRHRTAGPGTNRGWAARHSSRESIRSAVDEATSTKYAVP